jgi:DNA-binding transcriptional MocR family regulator
MGRQDVTDRELGAAHLARLLGSWRRDDTGAHLATRAAYAALADRVRLLVLDGRLPLRTRLPAERTLADVLGVSRTTVTAAYEQLREQGFLHSRQGAGSWTSLPADAGPTGATGVTGGGLSAAGDDLLDLAHAAPPAPVGALHRAVTAAVLDLPRHLPTHGYHAVGLPELRAAVAARFEQRGLPTSADQVLITNGAQHAWALVLRLIADPGDRILVEAPTYPNALEAVRAGGGRPVPVGLTRDGWDLEMLAATLRQASPRLAYLLPDHQNPTGLVLGAEARVQVAVMAARARTPLVIDETLAELTLDDVPPPAPFAATPGAGTVVTVGSMSKTFWGGLRVGWIRADADLVRRLSAARAGLDLGTPVLEQLVATHLLGDIESVLATKRDELRPQRAALEAALHSHFPAWSWRRPSGGLSLWVELDAPISSLLAATAQTHGLAVAAGPRFGIDGSFERFLRLPFTLGVEVFEEAVQRLAAARAALGPARTDHLAGSAIA